MLLCWFSQGEEFLIQIVIKMWSYWKTSIYSKANMIISSKRKRSKTKVRFLLILFSHDLYWRIHSDILVRFTFHNIGFTAFPGGILLLRIEDALYFANVGAIKALFKKIEKLSKIPLVAVIIDMKNVSSLDSTALHVLKDIVHDFQSRGIPVCFVKLKPNIQVRRNVTLLPTICVDISKLVFADCF